MKDDALRWRMLVGQEYEKLKAEWGIPTTLSFNGRLGRRTLARYHMGKDEIQVGMLDNHSLLSIRDIIRHEVAHAVDFHMRGISDHSTTWRAVAVEVGCRPRASSLNGEREAYQRATQKPG